MLIERAPLDHLCLQLIVDLRDELEREGLEDRRGRNAVCEQVVEFRAHLQDPGGRVLGEDFGGDQGDQGFPVRRRDWGCVCDFLAGGPAC